MTTEKHHTNYRIGATLPQRLSADLKSEQGEGIEPVRSYQRREDLLKAKPAPDVDVLLVELPTLGPQFNPRSNR